MSEKPSSVKYSVLDLSPVLPGGDARDAFLRSADLAKSAEKWGYTRYWVAEHHNIPGVASAATSVVIGYLAEKTKSIRVGAGGIMLPNHAPLVIAEQFGTLESMYPGRIDLGLGRAPGGDGKTARALRRGLGSSGDSFIPDLGELRGYFGEAGVDGVKAVPGSGLSVPIYILGSSDFGARVAAGLGLPFAFASHFAPDYMEYAIKLYREHFKPSDTLAEPYVMVGMNCFAAETDREAERLFTTLLQVFTNLIRGTPGLMPEPVDSMEGLWNAAEEAHVRRMTRVSVIGSRATVKAQMEHWIDALGIDEVILTAHIHDHAARLRSYEIASDVMKEINCERGEVCNV